MAKGMVFNTPDAHSFGGALVKARFYGQWQRTYGVELDAARTLHR